MNQREESKNYGTVPRKQEHVHELQGSVRVAEQEDPHGHRFSTVTGEVIPIGANDHIHEVAFITDFHDGHYHEFRGRTGGTIQVNDRHVHFLQSVTSIDDNHSHEFEAATMINNPAGAAAKEKMYYGEEYPEQGEYSTQGEYQNENEDMYGDNYYPYREDNYQMY